MRALLHFERGHSLLSGHELVCYLDGTHFKRCIWPCCICSRHAATAWLLHLDIGCSTCQLVQ